MDKEIKTQGRIGLAFHLVATIIAFGSLVASGYAVKETLATRISVAETKIQINTGRLEKLEEYFPKIIEGMSRIESKIDVHMAMDKPERTGK